MCGLAGYVLVNKTDDRADAILRMTRILAHRGPDDEGITLIDPEQGLIGDYATEHSQPGLGGFELIDTGRRQPHRVAFGHRRFSIIDTSIAGHQPFWSTDRRVCPALNGEIYNYVELCKSLEALGHRFRTNSDTEVLAEAYVEWGEAWFSRMNGFCSLCLFDAEKEKKSVLLARDRLGKAPLYVYSHPRGLYWASEIKALAEVFSTSDFGINESALADLVLTANRDLGHRTLYANIESFPSASFAWIAADGSYDPVSYWAVPVERRPAGEVDFGEAIVRCRDLLEDALRIRMRADVPVGFELSGGMDSSAIVGTAATSFDTPFLDRRATRAAYDTTTKSDPSLLWRTVSVGLWWQRCIQHEALS